MPEVHYRRKQGRLFKTKKIKNANHIPVRATKVRRGTHRKLPFFFFSPLKWTLVLLLATPDIGSSNLENSSISLQSNQQQECIQENVTCATEKFNGSHPSRWFFMLQRESQNDTFFGILQLPMYHKSGTYVLPLESGPSCYRGSKKTCLETVFSVPPIHSLNSLYK